MAMKKFLHQRDDIDKLYVSRKEGGGFASIGDCMGASMQGLKKKKLCVKNGRKRNCQH